MSFTTSIYGNAPANTFVYTTTTVSVDNISVENLSATNASISVLTTDIFNPINVNATNIECTNLTVLDTGNFSEIYTSYIHTSNMSLDGTLGGHTANFVTVNTDHCITDALYINEQSVVLTDKSLIKRDANQVMFIGKNSSADVTGADFLFRTGTETDAVKLTIPRSSDIIGMIALDVDTSIQATTGVFSAINTSDLNVADTTTLAELEVLTSASIKNLTVIGPNGLVAAKAGITNASITNASITNLTVPTINSSTVINASTINAKLVNTSNLSAINLTSTHGTITTIKSTTTNASKINASNISVSGELDFGTAITGPLVEVNQIIASQVAFFGMRVNSSASINILNASNINTSNLSAINASIDNNLNVRFGVTCGTVNTSVSVTAPKLNGTNISSTNISAANITATSVISAPTLTATTTFSAPGGSIDNFTTKDIVINDLVTAGSAEFQRGNDKLFIYGDSTSSADITIEPSISRVTMTNISAQKITGDIRQMLNAGTGIALSTNTNGITTIINTGGSVTDPLNLSTLNASTINVSTLNADDIEGFTKSTEYAFQATSSQNSNQSVTAGTVLNFNLVQYETPPPVVVSGFVSEGYDTTLKQYLIPVSGYYQFGFKAFIQGNSDNTFRLAMYVGTPGVGDALIGRGGSKAGMSEDFAIINYFDKGQWVYIKGYSGTEDVYMGDANDPRSWFWGHKLTPANNLITSTTNLSIQNLSVADDMTATTIKATNISATDLTIATSLTGAGNINITGDIQTTGVINGATLTGDIAGNLSAGTGIVLSTAAGVTNISNSAPYQLPISRVFSARTTGLQTPNQSGDNYYTNYNQIDQACSHVNYVAVPISTGGANTGAIIQTAGTYKITFTQHVYNESYTNRVSWWTRATKNGIVTEAQTFIYTRSDQTQYAQWGSNSITWIEPCAVNDYIQVWTTVAKNTPLYNNTWQGLRGGTGSIIVIELLT